jgi:hypothetical protein
VPVDAAELAGCLPMPAAIQRSTICPSRQRLTLAAWSRQISIIDSIELVLRNVRARVGGTPRRPMVKVSASPSRRLAAAPGWERSSSRARASSSAWATSGSGWW